MCCETYPITTHNPLTTHPLATHPLTIDSLTTHSLTTHNPLMARSFTLSLKVRDAVKDTLSQHRTLSRHTLSNTPFLTHPLQVRDAVKDTVRDTVKSTLASSFRTAFESSLLPAFQIGTDRMFAQVQGGGAYPSDQYASQYTT